MHAELQKILEKENKGMTIGDFLKRLNRKEQEEKEKEESNRNKFCEKVKGKILLRKDIDMFGNGIKIFKIDDIKFTEKDYNFNDLFAIKGTRLEFFPEFANLVEMDFENNSYLMVTLESLQEIPQSEWDDYLIKYERINEIIEDAINQN